MVRRAVVWVGLIAAVGCRASDERPKPEPVVSASAAANFCTGCGGHHDAKDEKDAVRASRAKPGDLARCPVSGAVFRVRTDSPIVEHSGKRAPVCCDGCKARFVQSPERFASLM